MLLRSVFLFAFVLSCVFSASAQLEFERSRHKDMLRLVKEDVKKNYFDPTFKGIDIE